MGKIPLTTSTIFVNNIYGSDTEVGLNINKDASNKVQAFVDCFTPYATLASAELSGLPVKFILAQWGAESGWGSTRKVHANQNWGCIKGTSLPISKGRGGGGYSIFYGANTFKDAYVNIFKKVSNYKELMEYLTTTTSPTIEKSIDLISTSGYNAGPANLYRSLLIDCVASIDKRTDFCD